MKLHTTTLIATVAACAAMLTACGEQSAQHTSRGVVYTPQEIPALTLKQQLQQWNKDCYQQSPNERSDEKDQECHALTPYVRYHLMGGKASDGAIAEAGK